MLKYKCDFLEINPTRSNLTYGPLSVRYEIGEVNGFMRFLLTRDKY